MIQATISSPLSVASPLSVDMLVGGLVWGVVGVPFRRLVGDLVVG
jgi:hypothetical protein